MPKNVRLIALYLPQYHPIPENNEWWGEGFTEWTNTAKAKPLFRGHYQPHVPADLGFYDLRLSESRTAQAMLAMEYGIEAFCYYHYWFAGKQLLDKPFKEVLHSKEPDFPFCLCWANETWTGIWHGAPNRILIEQTYPGKDDHEKHFESLLPAFTDPRYIRVNGKPLFGIYRPFKIPEYAKAIDLWREMAIKSGLKGIHFVGMQMPPDGSDISCIDSFLLPNIPSWSSKRRPLTYLKNSIYKKMGLPAVYSYEKLCLDLISKDLSGAIVYPCLIPNWDNTPRSGKNGVVLNGSHPEFFRRQVARALEMSQLLKESDRIIFVKSWNEWAEGNHLEPDMKFKHGYLKVLKEEIYGSSAESVLTSG